MFANYAKIVLRSIRRHPVFAVISISSLAIGFAAFLVITVFVQDERSYDRMHENADQTFRLVREFAAGLRPNTPAPAGPLLRSEYPEVKSLTRVFRYWHDPLLGLGEKGFIEDNLLFVDSTFFEVFSFPMLRGSEEEALVSPMSIVLTPAMARRYFGDVLACGKSGYA